MSIGLLPDLRNKTRAHNAPEQTARYKHKREHTIYTTGAYQVRPVQKTNEPEAGNSVQTKKPSSVRRPDNLVHSLNIIKRYQRADNLKIRNTLF
jgi:hypothetical protein